MAEAMSRLVVTRMVEWRLHTPCAWTEVGKTMSMIGQDLIGAHYDDDVIMTVGDDEIIWTYSADKSEQFTTKVPR